MNHHILTHFENINNYPNISTTWLAENEEGVVIFEFLYLDPEGVWGTSVILHLTFSNILNILKVITLIPDDYVGCLDSTQYGARVGKSQGFCDMDLYIDN